jgi:hypothetical protein
MSPFNQLRGLKASQRTDSTVLTSISRRDSKLQYITVCPIVSFFDECSLHRHLTGIIMSMLAVHEHT